MYTAQAYEEGMQLEIISYHIDKARGRKVFVFNKKKYLGYIILHQSLPYSQWVNSQWQFKITRKKSVEGKSLDDWSANEREGEQFLNSFNLSE